VSFVDVLLLPVYGVKMKGENAMMYKNVQNVTENIEEVQGNYIRFGGMGIMDGLSLRPTKNAFYKIQGMDADDLHLKGYRMKRGQRLPSYNWNQQCEIITPKQFKILPIY
jgi:hypothetical protein